MTTSKAFTEAASKLKASIDFDYISEQRSLIVDASELTDNPDYPTTWVLYERDGFWEHPMSGWERVSLSDALLSIAAVYVDIVTADGKF